jgi:hypothetical protein
MANMNALMCGGPISPGSAVVAPSSMMELPFLHIVKLTFKASMIQSTYPVIPGEGNECART